MNTGSKFSGIIERKQAEIEASRAATTQSEIEALVAQEEPPRNFFRGVTRHRFHTSIIAEYIRQRPSGTLFRPPGRDAALTPDEAARRYHAGGAAGISVATDSEMGGNLGMIRVVKEAARLPVMRRDYIIDPWQLWESRAAGADAVVITAELVTEAMLLDLLILAQQLQLTAVIEVHDMEALLAVRPHVGFPHRTYGLISISNRDLLTMEPDLSNTLRLADMVEDRSVLVSDDGVRSVQDLMRLRQVGVRIALIGEYLMTHENPEQALKELLGNDAG